MTEKKKVSTALGNELLWFGDSECSESEPDRQTISVIGFEWLAAGIQLSVKRL
ncbi:hypothetical protein N8198_02725 [Gammaproteobacteria bacterium]|nr:hypothetical protein [Gammaproteobacteria bacterium]